jgi:hypothetical protein
MEYSYIAVFARKAIDADIPYENRSHIWDNASVFLGFGTVRDKWDTFDLSARSDIDSCSGDRRRRFPNG